MHLMKREGHVPAHDDEVTLRKVLDVHDTPDESEPVGAQRKHRTNKNAVKDDLQIDDGRPHEEQLKVIPHVPFLNRDAVLNINRKLIKRASKAHSKGVKKEEAGRFLPVFGVRS